MLKQPDQPRHPNRDQPQQKKRSKSGAPFQRGNLLHGLPVKTRRKCANNNAKDKHRRHTRRKRVHTYSGVPLSPDQKRHGGAQAAARARHPQVRFDEAFPARQPHDREPDMQNRCGNVEKQGLSHCQYRGQNRLEQPFNLSMRPRPYREIRRRGPDVQHARCFLLFFYSDFHKYFQIIFFMKTFRKLARRFRKTRQTVWVN
jgi:hypothetical protein